MINLSKFFAFCTIFLITLTLLGCTDSEDSNAIELSIDENDTEVIGYYNASETYGGEQYTYFSVQLYVKNTGNKDAQFYIKYRLKGNTVWKTWYYAAIEDSDHNKEYILESGDLGSTWTKIRTPLGTNTLELELKFITQDEEQFDEITLTS